MSNQIEFPPDDQLQELIDSVSERIKKDFPEAFEKDVKFQSFLTLESFKNFFYTLEEELIELNKTQETPYNMKEMIVSLYADAHKKVYGFKGSPENQDLAAMAVEYVLLHLSAETLFEDENQQIIDQEKYNQIFETIQNQIKAEKDASNLSSKIIQTIKEAQFESEYTRDVIISDTITLIDESNVLEGSLKEKVLNDIAESFFIKPNQ